MKKVMLFIASMLFAVSVNAASITGALTFSGATETWLPGATSIATVGAGTVSLATGDLSALQGGAFNVLNLNSDIFTTVGTGNAGTLMFSGFQSFLPNVGHSLTLTLAEVLDVVEFTADQFKINVMLLASMAGFDDTLMGFQLEGSHNGATGSFSASSPIPAVPVPAALFLFAPALLGFFGLRRKATALAA